MSACVFVACFRCLVYSLYALGCLSSSLSLIYICAFADQKKKLVNMEGVMLDNQESISEEVLGFFGKLYNVGEEDLWQLEGLDWSLI